MAAARPLDLCRPATGRATRGVRPPGFTGGPDPPRDRGVRAVPGYFAPVQIGRHSYVDGGVHSPTNAAVLRGQGLDTVVVIAPMSGPAGWRPGIFPAARRYAERLLQREVRALQAEGIRTVVFSPGPGEQQVMGTDMMSRRRLDEVIQQSFLTAGAYAATPEVADLIRRAADGRDG
jgi:NTE family protein